MKLGIDFGSSFTDAVCMDKNKLVKAMSFPAGKKIDAILPKFKNCEIAVTGAYAPKNLKNHVNEIEAIGLGGMFVSGKKEGLVVSVGSGTAMVSCSKKIQHIGGTPIGGRTLLGLAKLLLKTENLNKIQKMAEKGNLRHVDLSIADIYPKGIGLIPSTGTAAHFGRLKNFNKNDIALGLFNMIAKSIGTLAVFGAKAHGHKRIILTGRLVTIKTFRRIIQERINTLSSIPVTVPKNAEYATAIGAAIK